MIQSTKAYQTEDKRLMQLKKLGKMHKNKQELTNFQTQTTKQIYKTQSTKAKICNETHGQNAVRKNKLWPGNDLVYTAYWIENLTNAKLLFHLFAEMQTEMSLNQYTIEAKGKRVQ